MKWRHWAILIVLVLLNYIIFSTAFSQLAKQRDPGPAPTRTPAPTFEAQTQAPVSWVVLPTCTVCPTRTPITPSPTPDAAQSTATAEAILAATQAALPTLTASPSPTPTPLPPTPLPPTPVPPTPRPAQPTNPPRPAATQAPAPTAPPAPGQQFTAKLIWDPKVAPNCAGPAVAKQSVIRDTAGNPVNGVVVQANCYDNIFDSHPSGTPGEYEPGHYDFSFGQSKPQDWVCTFRVLTVNGQPVNSEVTSIHFDVNDCRPEGPGHQVAILNWTKNW